MDFKVGDLVIAIRSSEPCGKFRYIKGEVYTVTKIIDSGIWTINQYGMANGWATAFFLKADLSDLEKVIYGV